LLGKVELGVAFIAAAYRVIDERHVEQLWRFHLTYLKVLFQHGHTRQAVVLGTVAIVGEKLNAEFSNQVLFEVDSVEGSVFFLV
jgi:hypothetical protein